MYMISITSRTNVEIIFIIQKEVNIIISTLSIYIIHIEVNDNVHANKQQLVSIKSIKHLKKQEQSVPCKCREMVFTVTAAGLQMLEGGIEKANLVQQAMLSSGLEQTVVYDVASNE
jgi:hypothetical protein